jgi:predicted dienelactone hydrolase
MRLLPIVLVLLVASAAALARPTPRATCLAASGAEATRCLEAFLAGSSAEPAFTDAVVAEACPEDVTYALGALGVEDLTLVLRNACMDFGHELYFDAGVGDFRLPSPPDAGCAGELEQALARLRTQTIELLGPRCALRVAEGRRCRRARQEARARALARATARRIGRACAAVPSLAVEELVAFYSERVRHFVLLVYPPNDLGPSGDPGPFPVGVRTLELADASRTNVDGDGPRPVTVELWYPSTVEAIAGVERYVVNLLGLDVARTPSYREVARAAGPFPLVLFSHGNGGIRFQSLFLAVHLASHGYLVASPDHHGNTFLDFATGDLDAASAVNRPLDMRFVLDELLARNTLPGDFLAGAVDAARIGMSGHSFGAFTTLALATAPHLDPRIGAFMPLASPPFDPVLLGAITAPILIQGGSLDRTTPFDSDQRPAFEALSSGATVVGLAEIVGAGHYTFTDICEAPRNLVGFVGGFDEACTPEHLPWRHAHDLVNHLALNFFEATLGSDRATARRLRPRAVASLGDVVYQRK